MSTVSPTCRWRPSPRPACTPTGPGTERTHRARPQVEVDRADRPWSASIAEVFFTAPSTVVFRYRSAVTGAGLGQGVDPLRHVGAHPALPNCVSTIQSRLHRLVDRRGDAGLGRRREHRDEARPGPRRSSAPRRPRPCASGCGPRSRGRACPASRGSRGSSAPRPARSGGRRPGRARPRRRTRRGRRHRPSRPRAPPSPAGDQRASRRAPVRTVPIDGPPPRVDRPVDRHVAQRLDRRHLRRLAGRQVRRHHGDDHADDHARRRSGSRARRPSPCRAARARRPRAAPPAPGPRRCPATTPTAEAKMPVNSASTMTDAQHLLAARADRPQHRRLLGALRDRDREGVVDHERADDQRDDGEDHQEHVHERDALPAGFSASLVASVPVITSTSRSGSARARALPRARPGVTPGPATTSTAVEATGRAEHGGRGRRRERHDLGAAGVSSAAVGRDAGEPVLRRTGLADHADGVADVRSRRRSADARSMTTSSGARGA